ncbi:MAG: 16S rRNA methyltransferase [Candidatus Heimdallarchaeota archaeon]
MPLKLILVECGIELIPKELRHHSAVKKNFSQQIYSSQLLDNALHHSAMKSLENSEKRGRPDIAHLCLLNALGSVLNKTGNLEVFLHTVNNRVFKFNPEVRIARNYNRFKGLIAKTLIDGNITLNGNELISEVMIPLDILINNFNSSNVLLLSSKGKQINNYNELNFTDSSKTIVVLIGGFQKGSFSLNILSLSKNLISISQYPLDAWIVTNKIITYYELSNKIH